MILRQCSKWKPRFDITKMQENNKKIPNNFCMVLYSISKHSGYKHKGTFFFLHFCFPYCFLVVSTLGFPLLYCWSTILISNFQHFLLVVGTNMLANRPLRQKKLATNFAFGFLNNQFQVPLAIEHMP